MMLTITMMVLYRRPISLRESVSLQITATVFTATHVIKQIEPKKMWQSTRKWCDNEVTSAALNHVYTIQPVVNRLWNRLNKRFYNWLDNRLYRAYKHSTGCPMSCWTACAVWQLVEQPAASCKQTFNRLNNRIDNRLYRVNGVLERRRGRWCPSIGRTAW